MNIEKFPNNVLMQSDHHIDMTFLTFEHAFMEVQAQAIIQETHRLTQSLLFHHFMNHVYIPNQMLSHMCKKMNTCV